MKLRSLQSGRAIAAILVLLFHLGGAYGSDTYFGADSYKRAFSFGYSGVEFFFVLSGFIITWSQWQSQGDSSKILLYLKSRAIRIYPAYWAVLFPVAILAYIWIDPQILNSLSAFEALKTVFLVPQDPGVVGGTGAPIIIVAWSLQYEMTFYILFLLFFVDSRLFFVSLVMTFVFLILARLFWQTSVPFSFLNPYYILAFIAGVSTAWLHRKYQPFKPQFVLALGLVIWAVFSGLHVLGIVEKFSVAQSSYQTVVFASSSAAIVYGLVGLEMQGRPITSPLLERLGDSSYALYLIHFPLISLMLKFSIGFIGEGPVVMLISFAVMAITIVAVSHVFHILIERPMLKASRAMLWSKTSR